MNRIVRRILLVVVVVASLDIASPAARAAGETIRGGCFFVAVATHPSVFNGSAQGFIAGVSVTTDSGGNPIFATVSCKMEVNGVDATPTFSYSGIGAQVGVDLLPFIANSGDSVAICQRESYETGTTTPYSCRSVTEARVPTQPVSDLTTDAFSVVEPVTCPALGRIAGSYPGGVVVTDTGDVYLPDVLYTGPIYDCPPYGTHATDAPLNTNRSPYLDVYFALPPGVSGGLLAMAR